MSDFSYKNVLHEVETAIHEKNYGRMYDLGLKLVKQSSNDNSWLEAAIIIVSYLVKSNANLWNALDLSKRAALAAPEQSRYQEITTKSLVMCVNAFAEPKDRVEAAYTVVSVTPKDSLLMIVCLDLMLDNIPGIACTKEQKRYLKIVIHYSPKDNSVMVRAEILMRQVNEKSSAEKETPITKDDTSLLGFLNSHKNNLSELFESKMAEATKAGG